MPPDFMEDLVSSWFPPLLVDFLLTGALSLLIGLGLREYHIAAQKNPVFGSTRTCVFIGMAGFALFQLDPLRLSFLAGMLLIGALLGLYYRARVAEGQFGMISILVAFLCYLLGPITETFPKWFLVLFAMVTLLTLNAKPRIAWLARTIANDDILSLAKFLVLAGVILPLAPDAPMAPLIPVSPHQTWLAVVVVCGISFAGYLLHAYVAPGKGLLLTGAIGGLYSSTATTVAIARQSSLSPGGDGAAAIILASAIMFLRLLAIAAIFNAALCLRLLPVFLVFAGLLGGMAYRVKRRGGGDGAASLEPHANPLDIGSALVFALLFVTMTAITHWVLQRYPHTGLLWLSGAVGFADIDPFVLSLVQGDFAGAESLLAKAVVIAASSNNLLKAFYAWLWSGRETGRTAGGALLGCAALGFLTAALLP
ncbi:MgtC/SapB family protein [Methylomagnum ishizawai]|uniref:MgtC/SapB family protein n=1 Tax=Methylomagnum ishizawai TaxID=1760988 RepID=UPI001C7EE222|nr:DUF4010 domain-containing protein [Methylomagnum ishizawai]